MAATVLGTAIFGILDPTNAFISPTTGPIIISIMFVILISCFAVNGVSLNTARDLGSRFAMGAIYGRGAFQGSYCAIASLTNILGYLLGATFQTLVLSDTVRPPTAMAACNHQHQVQTEEAQLARKLENKNGGKSLGVTSTQSRRNSPPSDSSEKPIREIV